MIAVACGLLALLVVLELCDLRRRTDKTADPPRLRWPALVFLAAVAALYVAVEAAGTWLAPGAGEILESCRRVVAEWSSANGSSTAAASQPTSALPAFALGVVVFYLAGFWDYAIHRLFSHSRWFWWTHEYHHLPRRVCLFMPGILGRPFAALPGMLSIVATAATAYVAMFVLCLPLWDLRGALPVLLAVAVVLVASHSSYLRRRPGVHRILRWACITTPQEHLLHHAADLAGNYGNFTTLWDRAFGTYLDPAGRDLDAVRLGLNYDQDFLGALTGGWFKLPSAWRRRFQLSYSCPTDAPESGARSSAFLPGDYP